MPTSVVDELGLVDPVAVAPVAQMDDAPALPPAADKVEHRVGVGGGPPASSGPIGSVTNGEQVQRGQKDHMSTVDHEADELIAEQRFEALPERVQEALSEPAGAAKEGPLALSAGVAVMADQVDEVVGPKDKRNPDRAAVRHGHEASEVTLGARRVPVERPRERATDGRARCRLGPMRTSLTATR